MVIGSLVVGNSSKGWSFTLGKRPTLAYSVEENFFKIDDDDSCSLIVLLFGH